MKITFIGGGNMASAMISGLLQQGYPANKIRVVEINEETREKIEREFNIITAVKIADGILDSNVILLTVKPQQISIVTKELGPLLKEQLVISIAAGIRIMDICRWLGGYERVIRSMPNTPAIIRSAVTGLYASSKVGMKEREDAETILSAIGSVLWLEHEELMDVVTAISGSGPAYIFYFIEAMQQAGKELGLDETQARQLSLETFLGAAKLANQKNEDVITLRARVTSKNGVTERAIQIMEDYGVKNKIIQAIQSSMRRSKELGDEFSGT